jgi:hypothetical protein
MELLLVLDQARPVSSIRAAATAYQKRVVIL